MVNDCMEIFMDDFTLYGSSFDEALRNLEKNLEHCEQTHLSLSIEKCHMMMSEWYSSWAFYLRCKNLGRPNQN